MASPCAREKDECGVGFVADARGTSSRAVLDLALQALGGLKHRGAVAADGISGDGAGILVPIPRAFLATVGAEAGLAIDADRLGVVMAFLDATDDDSRHRGESAVAEACAAEDLEVVGWRTVPVDRTHLGEQALGCLPAIRQALLHRPATMDAAAAERAALRARRRAEALCKSAKTVAYFASFSFHTVTYKGLVRSDRLGQCYPDLTDDRFQAPLALFHARFSTSTSPAWERAQPFRSMCHNGEIISVAGNEARLNGAAELGTEQAGLGSEELFYPAVAADDSDTGRLDSMMELAIQGGRDLSHALAMLVPMAWEERDDVAPAILDFYRFHSFLTAPWEGPAAICVTDGERITATVDRNGSRPLRWHTSADGIIVCASETGVADLTGHGDVTCGRVDPGTLLRVDPSAGGLILDAKVKESLSATAPYGQWIESNSHTLSVGSPGPIDASDELIALLSHAGAGSGSGDTSLPRVDDVFSFLRPQAAQLTSPAVDAICERDVMSLRTLLGPSAPVLTSEPAAARRLELGSFFLYPDAAAALDSLAPSVGVGRIDATMPISEGVEALAAHLGQLAAQALTEVRSGAAILVVDNSDVTADRAPIPSLFALGAISNALATARLQSNVSLVVDCIDAFDPQAVAALLSYGADVVCPRGALWLATHEATDADAAASAAERLRERFEAGVLAVIGNVGIGTLASYRLVPSFEAIGLDQEVIDACLRGTDTLVGGIGFATFARAILARHGASNGTPVEAVGRPARRSLNLLDLVEPVPADIPCALDVVEPVDAIAARLFPATSESSERREATAAALSSLGSRHRSPWTGIRTSLSSNNPPTQDGGGTARTISTGRFGVTPGYLCVVDELHVSSARTTEVSSAQADAEMSWLRVAGESITTMNPTAHHDIYSIEDLAQLIYDLKQVNPGADVSVQLLSDSAIGSTASGLVKSLVEIIHVASTPGAYGRPGIPWEIGLAQAHRALVDSGLRDRVRLRADANLDRASDVLRAALLGADEVTVRVGADDSTSKTPTDLAADLSALVGDIQGQLARLGVRTFAEAIGRVDMLRRCSTGDQIADSLDLSVLLAAPQDAGAARHFAAYAGIQRPQAQLDQQFYRDAFPALLEGHSITLDYQIHNADRSVGCALAGAMALEWSQASPPGKVVARFHGEAGQSFAAFTGPGVVMELLGAANDFAAKGLGGGHVVIRPAPDYAPNSVLAGNAALYGATSGELLIAGRAGQRFGVRNDGAVAVVEGTGDNACEYMSGGTVVILGDFGYNLGAGLTGGQILVFDPNGMLSDRLGPNLHCRGLGSEAVEARLKELIVVHNVATGSPVTRAMLDDWATVRKHFQVCAAD
ncbi:MAG: glutamate synthase central domain-containing protein [Actinomycetes bacterium]